MTTVNQRQVQVIESVSAIVQAGETVSNAVNFFGTRAVALRVPELVNSSSITFQVSLDLGETYQVLADPDLNIPVSVAVDGSSKVYYLHAKYFAGVRYIKVVIDVEQAEDAEFLLAPLELY